MRLPPPITSRSNGRVKALRAALSGAARGAGDLLGLEGPNLIREANHMGLSFDTVYLREGDEARHDEHWLQNLKTENWAVLSKEVFDSAVSTASPQGVAATWLIQEPKLASTICTAGLIVEDLQDPGNLGTLIRSAAAFGIGNVAVTPETVNHWNPKVVRAAAGAIFRTRVHRLPLTDIVGQLRGAGIRIFAAVSGFRSGPEDGFPREAAPLGVLTGRTDSENAKGARYPPHPWEEHASGEHRYAASLSEDTDFLEPCAIMIGNEGAGLSPEARRLADEQVLIPCSVESLNAAVAGSILMYEVMRQRSLRLWALQQGLRS